MQNYYEGTNPLHIINQKLVHIGREPQQKNTDKKSFACVYAINKEFLNFIEKDDFDIMHTFKRHIDKISCYEFSGFWEDLGSIESYIKANALVKENATIMSQVKKLLEIKG